MKKILVVIISFLPLLGFAQGTNFVSADWETVVKKAKAENKLIFVDCYFEGCMPCKQMDLKVYPDPTVGEVLNKDFISFKTDVFKEDIGKTLCRKYGIHGFPSFLFLTPDGKLIDQSSGYFSPAKLINYVQQVVALNKAGKYKKYSTDLNTPYPYFYDNAYKNNVRKVSADTVAAYLNAQTDLFTEQVFCMLNNFQAPEKYGDWFIANKERLIHDFGQNPVRNHVLSLMAGISKKYASAKDDKGFDAKLAEIKPVFLPTEWANFGRGMIDGYYKNSKNVQWYITTIEKSGIYEFIDKGKAVAEILPLIKDDTNALKTVNAWYKDQLNASAAQCDFYNAAVISFYLKDYKTANELYAKAKTAEKSYGLSDKEFLALETAINQKSDSGFQPAKSFKFRPMLAD